MAHNVLYYNSSDGAITQFSNTDIAQLSEYVLELMAANTYAGTITVSNSNPIGFFVDTVRVGGVGSNDITILSNTYTLSQVANVQSTTDPPMYLGLIANNSGVVIQENLTTLNDLADEVIQSLISDYGVNSYYLGVNPPSDGGTWVSRGALLDTFENFTVTNSDYRLWHKTASASYTSYKAPLKLGPAYEIMQWTSADVQNLIKKVEERIVATGIGTYALQSSSPDIGTWVSAGQISDVRRVVNSNPSYTSQVEYSSTFDVGSFTGLTPINYSGSLSYTGADSNYSGPGLVTYSGPLPYTDENNLNYSGPGFISYLGVSDYTGSTSYLGGDSTNYLAEAYSGPLPTDYINSYFGPSTFQGIANFNSFLAIYYGPTPEGAVVYSGPSGSPGPEIGYATTIDSEQYIVTTDYSGEAGFGATYSGINPDGAAFVTIYTGPFPFTGPAIFTNPDALTYDGSTTTTYSGPNTFDNVDGSSYVGSGTTTYASPTLFTNPDGVTFIGQISANYTGPTDYTGSASFDGPNYSGPISYLGPATYNTLYSGTSYFGPGTYTGPSEYLGTPIEYTVNNQYTGPYPTMYFTLYSGPSTYAGFSGEAGFGADYSGDEPNAAFYNDIVFPYTVLPSFTGTAIYSGSVDANEFIATFQDSYSGSREYTNEDVALFAESYLGTLSYIGTTAASYESVIYTNENAPFIGAPIIDSTTETIDTVTLWKRVA